MKHLFDFIETCPEDPMSFITKVADKPNILVQRSRLAVDMLCSVLGYLGDYVSLSLQDPRFIKLSMFQFNEEEVNEAKKNPMGQLVLRTIRKTQYDHEFTCYIPAWNFLAKGHFFVSVASGIQKILAHIA